MVSRVGEEGPDPFLAVLGIGEGGLEGGERLLQLSRCPLLHSDLARGRALRRSGGCVHPPDARPTRRVAPLARGRRRPRRLRQGQLPPVPVPVLELRLLGDLLCLGSYLFSWSERRARSMPTGREDAARRRGGTAARGAGSPRRLGPGTRLPPLADGNDGGWCGRAGDDAACPRALECIPALPSRTRRGPPPQWGPSFGTRPRLLQDARSKTTSSGERRAVWGTRSEPGPCSTAAANPQRSMIAMTAGRVFTSSYTAPVRFARTLTVVTLPALTEAHLNISRRSGRFAAACRLGT